MNKYIINKLWLIVLVVLFTGCDEDFLEVPVLVDQTAENFDPATAVTAAYNISINATAGSYPNIRWFNWQTFLQGDAMSDDAFKSGSGFNDQPGLRTLELFQANSANEQSENFWRSQYIKIYYMNYAIAGIQANRTISESLRDRYLAEVKFLRALNFFMLNRAYGGVVPVFALGMNPEETPRASEAAIYRQLEEDLMFAISVLPEKSQYPLSDLGRATKGAARGLLAKIYLYQQKNQECFEMCREIIESSEYQLESDFADLWKRGLPEGRRNEHGVESLFEFTHAPNPERSNPAEFARAQRSRMPDFGTSTGWGLINPTLDLLDQFEVGDPRIVSTIMFSGDSVVSPDGERVFAVDAGFQSPSNEHFMLNHKVNRMLTDNAIHSDEQGENLIVLRYADILLMYAEAANEIGNSAEALEKLNMIRARARNSIRTDYRREFINFNGIVPYTGPERTYLDYDWDAVDASTILPDITGGSREEIRHAIWRERRVEFALEGERFFDLVRQGRVEPNRTGNVMRAFGERWNNEKGKFFEDGKHELFPIPQAEIDLLGTLLMPQNPGY
jgi:starch-binding outer membrane protein, SusD/RagB family